MFICPNLRNQRYRSKLEMVKNRRCQHDRRATRCTVEPCMGTKVCQHKNRKERCTIPPCIGLGLCTHKKRKDSCAECISNTPLEKLLTLKNRCVSCGKRLHSAFRIQEQLCQACSKSYNNSGASVRIEHVWRDIIIQEMQFEPTSMDQGLCPVKGLCQSKYRPDMLYLTSTVAILLELDENSHSAYNLDCEVARLCGLKEYFPDHIVLVIRLNPDNSNQTTLLLNDRTRVMVCVAEFYLRYPERLCLLRTNVSYLYYSGVKHIDEAITNRDSINVLPLISCAHPSSNRKFLA
jgi:hypothetical protein